MRVLALWMLLLSALLSGCAAPKVVQPDEHPAVKPAPEELKLPDITKKSPQPEEKKPVPVKTEKKPEEQYIMLNFENADIETVISTIGEMLRINYIVAPGVTGKITIQSHNRIPISELFSTFQTILEFNGYTAVKYGSFYRIVPIEQAKQQPVPIEAGKGAVVSKDSGFVTQQIPLEYVKANDIANIVRNLMPRGTDIVVYEPSNMLIVTTQPAGIMKFLKLLEAIDIPATDRDAIKTFVYNVENGEAKKLADILRNIYTARKTGGGPPVRSVSPAPVPSSLPVSPGPQRTARTASPQSTASVQEGLAGELEGEILIEAYDDINAIIIKATPRAYLSLLETIRKLDVQPKQVLIEVLIAEISLDNDTQFGIEWLMKQSVKTNNRDYDFDVIGGYTTADNANLLPYDTSRNAFSLAGAAATAAAAAATGGAAAPAGAILSHPANVFANIISPRKFDVLITAAASTGKLNVLASPHVLALDNKEAKIEIADEVPVATSITQPTTGGIGTTVTATSQVQFKSAGTILTVTPHINEKKQVTLKIMQEVSELGASVPIGGQDYQGFKTRKATTTAIVQDGHTLVLGGIITERKGMSRSGLPFLSDLPLIGYLFGTTSDTIRRKELILMVTPHVISNYEEADELTRELKDRVQSIKQNIEQRQKKIEKTIRNMEEEKKD
ncbi:MAG: secretin N-terminal domain-containing protein [Thermodesulfovibrionales bacterium]